MLSLYRGIAAGHTQINDASLERFQRANRYVSRSVQWTSVLFHPEYGFLGRRLQLTAILKRRLELLNYGNDILKLAYRSVLTIKWRLPSARHAVQIRLDHGAFISSDDSRG